MTLNIAGSRGRTHTTRAAGVATVILLLATAMGCSGDTPTTEEAAAQKAALETALVQAKEAVPKELNKRGFKDAAFGSSRYYAGQGLFVYYFVSAGDCRGTAAVSGTILNVSFADKDNKNVTLENASAKDVFAHPELGKVCKAIPTPATQPKQ